MSQYRIYHNPGTPLEWVVEDCSDDSLWLVPGVANGWERRRPYRGHRQALQLVPDYGFLGLGVPGQSSRDEPFAARLRACREAKPLTVSDLAESAGLSRQAVHDLESGRREPNLKTARALADVLGCSLDDLCPSQVT